MSDVPTPSTSGPLAAIKEIVRIADDERFSDEFLGQVVRSYLPELERLLAPDAMFLEHSKMRRVWRGASEKTDLGSVRRVAEEAGIGTALSVEHVQGLHSQTVAGCPDCRRAYYRNVGYRGEQATNDWEAGFEAGAASRQGEVDELKSDLEKAHRGWRQQGLDHSRMRHALQALLEVPTGTLAFADAVRKARAEVER